MEGISQVVQVAMLLCRKFNLALKKDVCYLNPDPRPPPFWFCQCSYCKQQAGGLGPGKKPVLLLLLNCFALFILGTFGLCCRGNSLCCQGNSTTFMWKFTLWWLILWRINKIIKHSCKEFIYSTLYIYSSFPGPHIWTLFVYMVLSR